MILREDFNHTDNNKPCLSIYFIELRKRLIRVFIIMLLLFIICFHYSSPLLQLIAKPLTSVLPTDSHLIATQISSPLLTPLQLAFNLAILLSMPCALWQLWQFLTPALYSHEQRWINNFFLSSLTLFFTGVAFCYWIVLPFLFKLFNHALPESILLMPDISNYLAFITRMSIVFGLCFQLPLVNLILIRLKIVSVSQLRLFRPYAIVTAFILGMLLTPPDILSQILLALPLCFLYEAGLFLCQRLNRA